MSTIRAGEGGTLPEGAAQQRRGSATTGPASTGSESVIQLSASLIRGCCSGGGHAAAATPTSASHPPAPQLHSPTFTCDGRSTNGFFQARHQETRGDGESRWAWGRKDGSGIRFNTQGLSSTCGTRVGVWRSSRHPTSQRQGPPTEGDESVRPG